ncbi:MAG: 50S ribosomal protein L15 [Candidatus Omnitrophota bacterium]
MLKLNDLKSPKAARKKKKVLGRGSGTGHGKTSTRGHKGQLSRTGKGKRPGFEGGQMPLIRRVPKRGFTSKFKTEFQIVNVQDLEKFDNKSAVNPAALKKIGLIHKLALPVKILAKGKLTKNIVVKAHRFSNSAIKAIEACGGKAEIIKIIKKSESK